MFLFRPNIRLHIWDVCRELAIFFSQLVVLVTTSILQYLSKLKKFQAPDYLLNNFKKCILDQILFCIV